MFHLKILPINLKATEQACVIHVEETQILFRKKIIILVRMSDKNNTFAYDLNSILWLSKILSHSKLNT